MTVEMRQEIVTLAQELPDEVLGEAIALLRSLVGEGEGEEKAAPSTLDNTDADSVMAAYQVISKKYRNALRELA